MFAESFRQIGYPAKRAQGQQRLNGALTERPL